MKNVLGIIGGAVIGLMAIDFLGFVAWVASGQIPVDSFYVGTITTHIIKLFI